MKRTLLLIALTATTTTATAASWTYQGTLNDGGRPATGNYDIRLTLINAQGTQSLAQPIMLYGVAVNNGSFAADVDFGIDLTNAPAMKLKTEVAQGGSTLVSLGEPARFDPKAALAVGACWSSTGDNGSNPTLNFLGNTDSQTMVVSSPAGVSMNKRAQITSSAIDLLVARKSNGDADADIGFETGSGKTAGIFVRDTNSDMVFSGNGTGNFDFFAADQQRVAKFNGRIKSEATGIGVADSGGGMWLGGTSTEKSFVGRDLNSANVTGIWADGVWRMRIKDDGQALFNVTSAPGINDDMVISARQAGDDSADLVLRTIPTGVVVPEKLAGIILDSFNGGLNFNLPTVTAGTPRLSISGGVGGNATLSNGGTWTNASSRNYKTAFRAVNPVAVLQKVIGLPMTTWTYIGSDGEGIHMGPMAEDFKAAFGLAGNGMSIATVDADGVALAAIQGLNQKLEIENAALRSRLEAIEARLAQ